MELTWNVWVAFALFGFVVAALIGYGLRLQRFLPWVIIKALREQNQQTEDIITKLSVFGDARENVIQNLVIGSKSHEQNIERLRQEYRELSDNYALAVNHKNDTQDELNQARIKYQDASERIKTLEKTVVNVTNKYNEARESCMVWITENSELITMVAELERIKKVSISRPLKKAKKK